jgi:hypothetical protein
MRLDPHVHRSTKAVLPNRLMWTSTQVITPEYSQFLVDCGIDSSLNPDALPKGFQICISRKAKLTGNK